MLVLTTALPAVVACQLMVPYRDVEADLSPMGLSQPPIGAQPPPISAQRVIEQVTVTEGSIEVVRMGQRVRLDGTTVWVLIFRRVGGDPCADCWVGRIVGGGPDYGDVAHFDAESLRAFKILIPDW